MYQEIAFKVFKISMAWGANLKVVNEDQKALVSKRDQ